MGWAFDNFQLDDQAFELRKAGQVVPIEPQVLSLLVLLVENRDRLLTKEEIVDAIWQGRAISDSALSSRIKSARQALDDDGKQQRYIKTVHGRGFRFVGTVTTSEHPPSLRSDPAAAPSGVPVAEPEIRFFKDRRGISIAYAISGSGPLLICPAWWVSHVEADWRLPSFRKFFGQLSRGMTLIRYDRPGAGASDKPDRPRTLEDEAALLEDLVTELGCESYSLFAISSSGPVAVTHAADHQQRVEKLCLFGSFADGTAIANPEIQHAMCSTIEAHWGLGSRAIADAFLPDAGKETAAAFAKQQRGAADAKTAAAMLKLAYEMDASGRLGDIRADTLIIHRRGDRAIPFSMARDMAKGIDGARLVPLEGRAHIPWFDGDDVASLAHDFLSG